jgi:hypothetical protein
MDVPIHTHTFAHAHTHTCKKHTSKPMYACPRPNPHVHAPHIRTPHANTSTHVSSYAHTHTHTHTHTPHVIVRVWLFPVDPHHCGSTAALPTHRDPSLAGGEMHVASVPPASPASAGLLCAVCTGSVLAGLSTRSRRISPALAGTFLQCVQHLGATT